MSRLLALPNAAFSLWVWFASFAWMLVGATITLVLLLVGLPYTKVHGWVTAPLFSQVLRLATVRLRVHYAPDFDPRRPSIFVQNHINLLDGHLAAAVIPHAFSGLMNAWQFKIPIYGWLMTMSKGIPVHRGRRDKLIEEISAAARERKAIGMSVLTFPEGHRTLDGKVHKFKRGVFLMARNAEMPVVPIAVRGLYDVNNKRKGWRFSSFREVHVYVGRQYETTGLDNEQVGELADRLQTMMATWVDEGRWEDLPTPDGQKTAATT